ncbi:TRP-domain-containing protein [Stipitochalara longipes BDJ]|nr:TRP-domain-containing protein [Stipitochalara longipes BDJ]
MRLFSSTAVLFSAFLSLLVPTASADRVFESSSLDSCQSTTAFSVSLFQIAYSPDNGTLAINVEGSTSITGNVILKVEAAAYGYIFLRETVNPCTMGTAFAGFCPLNLAQITFDTTYNNISSSISTKIPGIAFQIPDLDATVTVHLYSADDLNTSLACVVTHISNGKTVNQDGVKWATAFIAVLGLIGSALVSGLGHANTAAHVSLYAASLFNYFQALAIIGLVAVPLPPIVQAWTQDFNWSLGIIKVKFLQKFATWYQMSTGGTPSTILATLETKSVQVAKRAVEEGVRLIRLTRALRPRTAPIATTQNGEYIVTGIDRAAFRANIEPTNLFLTSLIFYCIFILLALVGLAVFKLMCELALRRRWFPKQQTLLQEFHDKWLVTLKGVIFRLILLGYPLMTILCLWQFTQNDSPGEIFLALVFLVGMTVALAMAAFNVITVAKRSIRIHRTPAFLLYSDATILNKWGFLYIPFKASAYFYIIPTLAYILMKGIFVGLVQGSGKVQSFALIIIEFAALIGACIARPWMDKPANAINISICVVNSLNAIFLLIFTDIFNGPGLLIGITGMIFFFLNVIFALVLLILVLVVVTLSLFRKDPESRYHPIADNRGSFIKSQTNLVPMELDQLGLSARGGIESEKDMHAHDLAHHQGDNGYPNTSYNGAGGPPSPGLQTFNSNPAFQPAHYHPAERLGDPYGGSDNGRLRASPVYDTDSSRPGSSQSHLQREKSPFGADRRPATSPWQRGAGYEH